MPASAAAMISQQGALAGARLFHNQHILVSNRERSQGTDYRALSGDCQSCSRKQFESAYRTWKRASSHDS